MVNNGIIRTKGVTMKKIRLKIDIADSEYSDRLSEYIKIKGLNIFEITDLNQHLTLSDLGSEDSDCLHLLSEKEDVLISKYQSADRIIQSVMENVSKCNEDTVKIVSRNCRVIFVTSGHGGAGKSCISQACAIYWARKGKKVMYINVDGFSVNESIFNTEKPYDISLLMHYTNKVNSDFNVYIERYKNHDSEHDVCFLSSVYPSCDTCFNYEQGQYFMNSLISNDIYDYIFIDCPLYANKTYIDMMKLANKTIFIKNKGSKREEEVIRFLENNGISLLIACNMVRYTEGVYIPSAEESISQNPTGFYDAIDELMYELEQDYDK